MCSTNVDGRGSTRDLFLLTCKIDLINLHSQPTLQLNVFVQGSPHLHSPCAPALSFCSSLWHLRFPGTAGAVLFANRLFVCSPALFIGFLLSNFSALSREINNSKAHRQDFRPPPTDA